MIHCDNLVKIYKVADLEVVALQGLDLHVEPGELMAIIGNSGSGKSTLLNMLGGLDRPSAGNLVVDGKDLLKFTEKDIVRYKRETVGFVWQNNARNLIPYLTALENVELPILLQGRRRRQRALELLEAVGLGHRIRNRLNQLSGGEQQRVAIAIALANHPRLLLADEPTGSLDTKMSNQILDLFRELNRSLGLTVVIVTHDPLLAKKVDRVVAIRDGKTASEFIRSKSYADELAELEQGTPAESETHVEYAILDKAGRLQIPPNYLEAVGMKDTNKMVVSVEDGKIVLLPPEKEKVAK
ncbi:MAG: transporter ATP-binding protein [Paenibacillus sp.]|jgi:ABC-type lipoprotein export system ATPase subunit|uniref:ATP-binding cassette domain-containing protein n=1 Tax=Paenibacillus hemerocallicola TaxID=1172614 RepID=A0A5C4TGA5_9BACL|nr:ABC transporter ATP-binding protein [Paenibacillus hemerocallicola]MDF2662538.1 transporter ATP-binding protein [Paenibacillus sp.]TNJ68133.1 ATP-binding cassette domain-containing protein [Paenibacillus hemerocallicola]